MKKIYLLAMMLCLLILPATAMAAPSANAKAFESEETISNQWIDAMLVKQDSASALAVMSADAKKVQTRQGPLLYFWFISFQIYFLHPAFRKMQVFSPQSYKE
mgnify:CR=1 FL=1